MTWPARAAALMAADLGVEPAAMQKVLEKYVRATSTSLPSPPDSGETGDDLRILTRVEILRTWVRN